MKRIIFSLALIGCLSGFAQTKKKIVSHTANTVAKSTVAVDTVKEQLVEITTPFGVMIAKLYNSTPLHRDNFISKAKEGFYDSLLFHRVIKDFMIQGGDPKSKGAPDSVQLGSNSAPGPMIPAEFNTGLIHKRGALAAARDGNPTKQSSNCQFYIVQGKRIEKLVNGKMEADTAQFSRLTKQIQEQSKNPNFHYTKAQKEIYQRLGGTPQLDQNYTVFGEVISGLDVIDRITSIPTKPGDRPMMNIWMRVKLLN